MGMVQRLYRRQKCIKGDSMIRINQLKLPITHTKEELWSKAAKTLKISVNQLEDIQIIRQSLDARKKQELMYVYSVDCRVKQEKQILRKVHNPNVSLSDTPKYHFPNEGSMSLKHRPVIVGFGPAGLFCGYMLAKAGYRPLILERGQTVEERQQSVERFWKDGVLDPESNVQFGEGGAGTFSDGKLNTLVKDREGRGRLVMKILHEMGAPEEITYQQKPHIGTDVLIDVVRTMRKKIEAYGGEVRFSAKMTDIHFEQNKVTDIVVNDKEVIPCDILILAPGHSARDTFFMLHERGVAMNAKSFAVGVRIEHPQSRINLAQLGAEEVPQLGAASYKLTHTTKNGRGVYSFCMCPGGYVVNASSEEGMLAVNGMSYQKRDSKNANSALIVTVTPEDYFSYGSDTVPEALYGVAFQRTLEKRAFEAGKGKIPVQLWEDYKNHCPSSEAGTITPCMKGAYTFTDVRHIFPDFIGDSIEEGILAFGQKIKGYDTDDVLISAVESRSSSPVRIMRGDDLQSDIEGFYPCGEGAGYAGGITSAAIDGIKVAEAVAKKYRKI